MTSVDVETVGSARLLQLAEHLERGRLGHKVFDFAEWNSIREEEAFDEKNCGTIGCALGECPFVWPDRWWFDDDDAFPALRGDYIREQPLGDAMRFFGLTAKEAEAVFLPGKPRPWTSQKLDAHATKEQVAESIRQFVTWQLAQRQEEQ